MSLKINGEIKTLVLLVVGLQMGIRFSNNPEVLTHKKPGMEPILFFDS